MIGRGNLLSERLVARSLEWPCPQLRMCKMHGAHFSMHAIRRRALLFYPLSVLIVAALPQLFFYLYRPMFYDEFGRGERWLFAGWHGVPGVLNLNEFGIGKRRDHLLRGRTREHGC